jgi:CopG family transcriptional regulator, nickel-responsive regulator
MAVKKQGSMRGRESGRVERVSLSLPGEVLAGLDEWSERRGFDSRSQAVASMIRLGLLEDKQDDADAVMAGSITLFFRQDRAGLLEELARLKRVYIDEVIGSLQVQLADAHLMEVLLVQGPVKRLRAFTNDMVTCKGVKAGSLNLTSELIPPLHPLPSKEKQAGQSIKK